jgi:hypothetical protein
MHNILLIFYYLGNVLKLLIKVKENNVSSNTIYHINNYERIKNKKKIVSLTFENVIFHDKNIT